MALEHETPAGKFVAALLRPNRLIALGLFGLALLMRIAFVVQSERLVDFRTPTPGLDICVQWEAARQIRRGGPEPRFELMLPSAPFHTYFLAFSQAVLGENPVVHRLVRACLGALSVVLVFLIGLRLTGSRTAATIAGVFMALLPSWVYFDTMLLKVSVEILVLCTAVWLILRIDDSRPAWQRLALGAILGALFAVLRFSQGASALYALSVCVYLLSRRSAAGLKGRLLVVVPMLVLAFGSQALFKYRDVLFGVPKTHFLPVGGVHFRIGFQERATGTYHVLQRFPALPLGHTFFSRMAAEAQYGRPLTPEEADRYYMAEARQFIREHPGEAAVIVLKKIGLFFNNFEPADNHYFPHVRERTAVLNMPGVCYGVLVILSFWGLVGLWRRRQFACLGLLACLIAAVFVPNLLGFVTWRYRLHVTVPFALLMAPGLLLLVDTIRRLMHGSQAERRAWMFAGSMALGTMAMAFLAFRTVLPVARQFMVSTADRNLQQSANSERFAKEMAEMDKKPALTVKERFQYTALLHHVGRYTESFRMLEGILADTPDELAANRQYLIYLIWYGDYDRVLAFLRSLEARKRGSVELLMMSFRSGAPFWQGSDTNMRLIVQAILRDIVTPRLNHAPRRPRGL